MDSYARHLLFHAALILLIGLLAGIPYGKAILLKKSKSLVHAWRVAHASLPMGAALMIALAAVITALPASAQIKQYLAVAFIVSGYGFTFALMLGPMVGARGLTHRGSFAAKSIYAGNMIGVLGSLSGTLLLIYAAWVSL